MPNFTHIAFTSVHDIPDSHFKEIGCEDSFYFSKPFLGAFEEVNKGIDYYYVVFFKKNSAIALAVLQAIDVSLDGASDNIPLSQRLARSLQCYLSNRKTHILVSGNVFLSGEYGLIVKRGVDRRSVYDTLSRKLKTIKTKKKARVFFLKDFNALQDTAVSIAEKQQFQSFAVEPNMRIPLQWDSFDGYKTSLKSKYRVKVNKADSMSAQLVVQSLSAIEIRSLHDELTLLYSNVAERSLFNAIDLQMETYALLKERFPETVYVHTYRKEERVVGFLTAFCVDGVLDAHFIGIDYDYKKTDAIYPRMLNDYLRLGMRIGVKEINLGRTASEIKSTLGATPEHLRCYVKHRRTAANLLFKPLVRQIKMTEYKQHTPFKK